MLSADHKQEKSYVITYKELVFTFVVFSIILFVLFPKDLLKEQIISEKSDYELSMLYLKNLLRYSPDDESLMLILATQSLRSGDKKLSISLLDRLIKSKDQHIRYQATLLDYDLEKEEYFYLKDPSEKRAKRKKIRKLFILIYKNKMYDAKELEKWYKESLFAQVDYATFDFLEQKVKKTPYNVKLLENTYYFAQKLKHRRKSLKYLKLLQQYDVTNRDKWIKAEYYMYVNHKEYAKAEKLLLKYADTSDAWKNKLAEFYIMKRKFMEASNIYVALFETSVGYKVKRKYFYKSVKALQAGSLFNSATNLAHKYEKFYFKDREARSFILKIYLASGRLDYADKFSKKIFKSEFK